MAKRKAKKAETQADVDQRRAVQVLGLAELRARVQPDADRLRAWAKFGSGLAQRVLDKENELAALVEAGQGQLFPAKGDPAAAFAGDERRLRQAAEKAGLPPMAE